MKFGVMMKVFHFVVLGESVLSSGQVSVFEMMCVGSDLAGAFRLIKNRAMVVNGNEVWGAEMQPRNDGVIFDSPAALPAMESHVLIRSWLKTRRYVALKNAAAPATFTVNSVREGRLAA